MLAFNPQVTADKAIRPSFAFLQVNEPTFLLLNTLSMKNHLNLCLMLSKMFLGSNFFSFHLYLPQLYVTI